MTNQTPTNAPIFLQPELLPLHGVHSSAHSVNTNEWMTYKRRPAEIVRELKKLRASPLKVDDDDDNRWVGQSKATLSQRPITKVGQLEELHLTRHRIEQLLNRAAFEQVMRNCFVRVNINGPDEKPVYRIGEVLGIEHLRIGYYMGNTATNIALQLRYDDTVMLHEINDLSNVPFTLEEFELWRDNNVGQAIQPPTTNLITQKKIELYNTLNSELKVVPAEEQNWVMPVRPEPKGGLVQRRGTNYPWQLRSPSPPLVPSVESPIEMYPELQLEAINEELEAKRSQGFDVQR